MVIVALEPQMLDEGVIRHAHRSVGLQSCVRTVKKKPQVPPLRFAPVGMTSSITGQVFLAEALAGTTELSSRPERTRISCYAALTSVHVCGFPLKKAA